MTCKKSFCDAMNVLRDGLRYKTANPLDIPLGYRLCREQLMINSDEGSVLMSNPFFLPAKPAPPTPGLYVYIIIHIYHYITWAGPAGTHGSGPARQPH